MMMSSCMYGNVLAEGDEELQEQIVEESIENVEDTENIEAAPETEEEVLENAGKEDEEIEAEESGPIDEGLDGESAEQSEDAEIENESELQSPETASPAEDFDADPEETEVPAEELDINFEDLLGTGIKYSELTHEEQGEAQEEYGIRADVFMDCESAGMDFEKTIEIGWALQTAKFTAQEYIMMLSAYTDAEEALYNLKTFGNYRYMFPEIGIVQDENSKNMLIGGKAAAEVMMIKLCAYLAGDGNVQNYADITLESAQTLLDSEKYAEFLKIMDVVYGVEAASSSGANYYYDTAKNPIGAFSYDRNANETINMTTGAVGYNRTEFTLPGANGLDLSISSYYDSSLSSNTEIGRKYNGGFNTDGSASTPRYENSTVKIEEKSPLNNFASGWSFNFSYMILTKDNFTTTIPSSLVMSDGSRMTMSKAALTDSTETKIPLNQYSERFCDLNLSKHTGNVPGGSTDCAYALTYKNGDTEYFNDYGMLICKSNRYGDYIKFEYEDNAGTSEKPEYQTVKITDTCGRCVKITKSGSGSITITVTDKNGADLGQNVYYEVIQVSNTDMDIQNYKILRSITDPEGKKTSFEYKTTGVTLPFAFATDSFSYGYQAFYPLVKITYPTGATTEYAYEKTDINGGKYSYFRVTSRKDTAGTESYDEVTYTYEASYQNNGDFAVSETNADGLTTRYKYKYYSDNFSYKYHVKASEEVYYKEDGNEKYVSKTEYSNYYKRTYPQMVKNIKYDEEQNTVEVYRNTEYNNYRDIVKSWDAYAEGDTSDSEHMTSYTYDDRYHIMTEKIYKTDANTTVREVNTLTSDGKNIAKTEKYINDMLVSKTEYAYYANNANPYREYNYTSGSEKISTYYQYQDKALITSRTTDGVSETYTYDGLGRNISMTDGNGNTTSMTYDVMGRILTQTNADGGVVTNTYPSVSSLGNIFFNRIVTEDAGEIR